MRAAKCFILALVVMMADMTRAEKGDTFTSEMAATTLPPSSPYTPGKTKATCFVTISDGGIKNNNVVYIWTADMFSLGKTVWQRIVLVNSKNPTNEFFTLASTYQPDFPNGNFTLGEIPAALTAAGLSMNDILDNSTYVVTVLDSTTNAAIAGVLTPNFIATYGNGSIADSVAAEEGDTLSSDIVFVADMNNRTLSFSQGFESGLEPTNGTATTILQQMPDGSFVWSMEMAIMRFPSVLELRYFKSLEEQPVLLNLGPTSDPVLPRMLPAEYDSFGFSGNITNDQIVQAVGSVGLDWNTVNFNTTPPQFLLTLTDKHNGSILGFIFNADDAPTPPPVIKGAASQAKGMVAAVAVALIASIIFI